MEDRHRGLRRRRHPVQGQVRQDGQPEGAREVRGRLAGVLQERGPGLGVSPRLAALICHALPFGKATIAESGSSEGSDSSRAEPSRIRRASDSLRIPRVLVAQPVKKREP